MYNKTKIHSKMIECGGGGVSSKNVPNVQTKKQKIIISE